MRPCWILAFGLRVFQADSDQLRLFIPTWPYRWPMEVLHNFCKPMAGFEAAQLRTEAAVKRYFCLSGLAQLLLHPAPLSGQSFGTMTLWARPKSPRTTVAVDQSLLDQGLSMAEVLEVLMSG